jgi:SAM-dependent methyltransferase
MRRGLAAGAIVLAGLASSHAQEPVDDARLVAAVRHGLKTGSSAFYNINIANAYGAIWSKHGTKNVAPVVLELGPGTNIAQGVAFVMRGARKYHALDIYKDPKFHEPAPYEAVAALVAAVSPASVKTAAGGIFSVADGMARFNPERLEFLYPRQSYDIPLAAGALDYAFSNAVFEHVSDPEATIKALRRVLKARGLTAHQIDMRDHRNFSRPLEYLKLDPAEWGKVQAKLAPHLHQNRWRLAQYRESFRRNGFDIVAVDVNARVPVTEEVRAGLHPDFREYSLEDLSAVGAMIIARRR